MKDRYIYPAVLDFSKNEIAVKFPDLPGCITCGDTSEEALRSAKEVLGLFLWQIERHRGVIPKPTMFEDLELGKNQLPTLIDVYMPLVRSEMENQTVKKTVTLPRWLNDFAQENGINFSKVLQDALKEKLGLKDSQI